jgi:hypothetical protein
VGAGSRKENASNQESRAPFRFNRNGKSSSAEDDFTSLIRRAERRAGFFGRGHSRHCEQGLFCDLTLTRSTIPVVWGNDPDKRMGLPVPYGCSLDELQAEAEKAMRELSEVAARIAAELPKRDLAGSMTRHSPVAHKWRCKKSRARPASPRSRPTSPVNGAGGITGCRNDSEAPLVVPGPEIFFAHG